MKNLIILLTGVLFLVSCSSDKVVSDSWAQKRKYRKGVHFGKHIKKEKEGVFSAKKIFDISAPLEIQETIPADLSASSEFIPVAKKESSFAKDTKMAIKENRILDIRANYTKKRIDKWIKKIDKLKEVKEDDPEEDALNHRIFSVTSLVLGLSSLLVLLLAIFSGISILGWLWIILNICSIMAGVAAIALAPKGELKFFDFLGIGISVLTWILLILLYVLILATLGGFL